MSAPDTDRRTSGPMVLLWAGAGVAPSAAALLVVGSTGGLLRAGAVLSMFSVMLVAFGAIYSRGGGSGGGPDGYSAEEVAALRQDVRGDINHAARMTHRVLTEKIMALSDTVEALRGQIEVLRAHAERSHLAAPGVQHTETVQVTRQTYASTGYGSREGYGPREGYGSAGPVYGSAAAYGSAAVPGDLRAEPPPPQERHTGSWTDQRLAGYGADAGRRRPTEGDFGQWREPGSEATQRMRERPDEADERGYDERGYGGRRTDPYADRGPEQGRVVARAALPSTGSGEPAPSWAAPAEREREPYPRGEYGGYGEQGRRVRNAPENEWR